MRPDGGGVLLSSGGQFRLVYPENGHDEKPLPGDAASFSPRGGSVVSSTGVTVSWWDPAGWRVRRTLDLSREAERTMLFDASFLSEDILLVEMKDLYGGWQAHKVVKGCSLTNSGRCCPLYESVSAPFCT